MKRYVHLTRKSGVQNNRMLGQDIKDIDTFIVKWISTQEWAYLQLQPLRLRTVTLSGPTCFGSHHALELGSPGDIKESKMLVESITLPRPY